MTLAALATACAQDGPRDAAIWRLVAFAARYGHQPIHELLRLPITDLMRFAEFVGDLLEAESRTPED